MVSPLDKAHPSPLEWRELLYLGEASSVLSIFHESDVLFAFVGDSVLSVYCPPHFLQVELFSSKFSCLREEA